jgi:hypothetical protein
MTLVRTDTDTRTRGEEGPPVSGSGNMAPQHLEFRTEAVTSSPRSLAEGAAGPGEVGLARGGFRFLSTRVCAALAGNELWGGWEGGIAGATAYCVA